MIHVAEVIAALTLFGMFVLLPLVWILMRHQRSMTELLGGNVASDVQNRIERLEDEIRELKAAHYDHLVRLEETRNETQRLN